MNYYRNPYAMLVGRVGGVGRVGIDIPGQGFPPGMMVPGGGQPMTPFTPGVPGPGGPGGWPGGGPGGWPGGFGWGGNCGGWPRWAGSGTMGGCYPNDICPPQSDGFYRQAMRSAVAAHEPQNALPLNSRDFGDGSPVPGGGTIRTLSTSPTVPMCLTQYIVARTSAPFFDIMSIKAARVEYLGDGGGMPAETLTPDSLIRPTQLPQLYPGTQISVTVRNNDADPQAYGSTFIGISQPGCTPCI